MVIVIFHEKNFCISNFMAEELASFSTFITCNNSRAKRVSEGSKLEVHLIVSNVSDGWAYFEYNSHSLTQEASFKETQTMETTFRHALVIPSRTWVFQDISFVMHGHLGDFPLSIPIILGSVTSWVTFKSTLTIIALQKCYCCSTVQKTRGGQQLCCTLQLQHDLAAM